MNKRGRVTILTVIEAALLIMLIIAILDFFNVNFDVLEFLRRGADIVGFAVQRFFNEILNLLS